MVVKLPRWLMCLYTFISPPTLKGGHASGFKGTTQQQATSPDVRLLQVRVTGENSRIVEVNS